MSNASSPSRLSRTVLFKLIAFALAIAVLPVSSFFLTQHRLFNGNASYAGAFAGVVANLILIAYVVVAFMEDDGTPAAEQIKQEVKAKEGKKTR
jgi:vacuolar ATPase assembly integral membrane protein VMA21